jgi:hypothetical protein
VVPRDDALGAATQPHGAARFCTNAYFDRINAIYREYIVKGPPARTFVTVGKCPTSSITRSNASRLQTV